MLHLAWGYTTGTGLGWGEDRRAAPHAQPLSKLKKNGRSGSQRDCFGRQCSCQAPLLECGGGCAAHAAVAVAEQLGESLGLG
jgi:hypothetical protein